MSDNYKSRYEKEARRANNAEARLGLLAKAVTDADKTAFAFTMDLDRTSAHIPAFVALAAAKVRDDIAHAYMISIGAR
jgi:hypothetical protein